MGSCQACETFISAQLQLHQGLYVSKQSHPHQTKTSNVSNSPTPPNKNLAHKLHREDILSKAGGAHAEQSRVPPFEPISHPLSWAEPPDLTRGDTYTNLPLKDLPHIGMLHYLKKILLKGRLISLLFFPQSGSAKVPTCFPSFMMSAPTPSRPSLQALSKSSPAPGPLFNAGFAECSMRSCQAGE